MATDVQHLKGPVRFASVQRLQNTLRTVAKEFPDRRFHALIDKVWRPDVLSNAWYLVRQLRGAPGVDGIKIKDIEKMGEDRWLGELSQELRRGEYKPAPVRAVRIPKKEPGKFRELGIPTVRDRVVQTAAMLVLEPILDTDLPPEQYGYRPGRGAHDAVTRIHTLLNRDGMREVVDADLSNFFGEIPHKELLWSLRRRVSDGRMIALVKSWLEQPVQREEKDKKDDRRIRKVLTNRARKERKGSPQGSPISPLLSNLYMRRFALSWKYLGLDRLFCSEVVIYADDFCILGKAPAEQMLGRAQEIMTRLKLKVNQEKTRCLRCPDEPFEFLGYRIGRNYRRHNRHGYSRRDYVGTRPSKGSVKRVCRRISEVTHSRGVSLETEKVVQKLNQITGGWANYFRLGQVSPAYAAIEAHAYKRLRQWLYRKHKRKSGKYVEFSDENLRIIYGLKPLKPRTKSLPWAKSTSSRRKAGCGKSARPV